MYVGRSLIKNCHVIIDSFFFIIRSNIISCISMFTFQWLVDPNTCQNIFLNFICKLYVQTCRKKPHRVQRHFQQYFRYVYCDCYLILYSTSSLKSRIRVDISIHSDTFLWFHTNRYSLLLFNTASFHSLIH